MEFTCHTKYDQQALTVMARAVRKTVRAKRSRMVRIWAWSIIALLAVSLWVSWGNVWQTAADCAGITALLLGRKESALNSYFAKRKALPGSAAADTVFYPDHFLVKTAGSSRRRLPIRSSSRSPGSTWADPGSGWRWNLPNRAAGEGRFPGQVGHSICVAISKIRAAENPWMFSGPRLSF
ncbi:hypothetical protein [Dysosmobacter sp.]|uniref:hypothetical protein n=1 Tax=Dysosmobacter sp. TaxID=2591382 RepID=UPI002A9E3144|nr:hypothetical protein [Dysosmobacter sp.]MDY5509612.1 hypothetical protein [Dysosmobacter sp.]